MNTTDLSQRNSFQLFPINPSSSKKIRISQIKKISNNLVNLL